MKTITTLLAVGFAIVAFAPIVTPSAKAELVLDNTQQLLAGSSQLRVGRLAAQGFTTTSGPWQLNSVTLHVSGTGGSDFSVSLYGNSGSNTPGALIDALSGNASPGTQDWFTYLPSSTLTLDGLTTYWIVAMGASGARYNVFRAGWNWQPEIWTPHPGLFSSDGGSTWVNIGEGGSVGAFAISIDATSDPSAVPEPGQVAASLLLLGGIGGYVFLKRRKAAKSAAPVPA